MASWVGGLFAFATVFWRTRPAGASGSPRRADCPRDSRLLADRRAGGGDRGGERPRPRQVPPHGVERDGRHAYGRWLAAKIVVFVAMLALGAWHQMWLAPRLTRALAARETAPEAVLAFRRSVRRRGDARPRRARPGRRPRCDGAAGAASRGDAGAAPAFRHERTFDEARVPSGGHAPPPGAERHPPHRDRSRRPAARRRHRRHGPGHARRRERRRGDLPARPRGARASSSRRPRRWAWWDAGAGASSSSGRTPTT